MKLTSKLRGHPNNETKATEYAIFLSLMGTINTDNFLPLGEVFLCRTIFVLELQSFHPLFSAVLILENDAWNALFIVIPFYWSDGIGDGHLDQVFSSLRLTQEQRRFESIW